MLAWYLQIVLMGTKWLPTACVSPSIMFIAKYILRLSWDFQERNRECNLIWNLMQENLGSITYWTWASWCPCRTHQVYRAWLVWDRLVATTLWRSSKWKQVTSICVQGFRLPCVSSLAGSKQFLINLHGGNWLRMNAPSCWVSKPVQTLLKNEWMNEWVNECVIQSGCCIYTCLVNVHTALSAHLISTPYQYKKCCVKVNAIMWSQLTKNDPQDCTTKKLEFAFLESIFGLQLSMSTLANPGRPDCSQTAGSVGHVFTVCTCAANQNQPVDLPSD